MKYLIQFVISLSVIFWTSSSFAQPADFDSETSIRINKNQSQPKYIRKFENGGDIGVTNGTSNDLFVPNNSQTEIDLFIANRPAGVSVCSRQDGGPSDSWSTWTEPAWSACSSCSQSRTRTRTRTCTNPTPSCGGDNCSTYTMSQSDPQTQACGTSPGGWSGWVYTGITETVIGSCSLGMDIGPKYRCTYHYQRTCSNPYPTCGGGCSGSNTTTTYSDTCSGCVLPGPTP